MTVSPLQMAVSPISFKHFPTLLHNLNNCIIIIILTINNIMIIMAHYQAIYDYHTGECMATMAGHSELVTGLAFSNDCRHLISVSGMMMMMMMMKKMKLMITLMCAGDSCVFVWRLPGEMVATMQVIINPL